MKFAIREFLWASLMVGGFVACASLGTAPTSPADAAPRARKALEDLCKADAAAVEAGLHKADPRVDEACEVVRAACK